MRIEEVLDSKLPFKAKHHKWLFDPMSYPEYVKDSRYSHWEWATGTFEELAEQEKMNEIE